MTHGSCVCNPAHAEKLEKKQGKEKSNSNNKGKAVPLLLCKHDSAILSLSLPLKNTDTGWEKSRLESGLKEQGFRQHFYSVEPLALSIPLTEQAGISGHLDAK